MRHFCHAYSDAGSLAAWLALPSVAEATQSASAVLVQVYAAELDDPALVAILGQLRAALPNACIVGASTVGELVEGRTLTERIVIGVSAFESARVQEVALPVEPGREAAAAADVAHRLRDIDGVCAALLLATPLSLDAALLLGALGANLPGIPMFGGGAGDYARHRRSAVFTDAARHECGLVLVAFAGESLRVEARSYLGWRPLSREMTLTECVGLEVRRIDGERAFDIYRRYLGIDDPARFFLDALEFPLLLSRDGRELARVPVAVTDEGGLRFVADVVEGERVRLGYGDPASIIGDAHAVGDALRAFEPEAIFLYTCGCRRFLMQEDVEQETLPFQAIAPTFGFYTYGEFLGRDARVDLLNSTMVAVGFSERPRQEGTARPSGVPASASGVVPVSIDPYANQHARIVGRLVHFIGSVSADLESAHREVLRLSRIDRLTGVLNRAGLDEALANDLARQARHREGLALLLIDIDHFKRVNDEYGHAEGARALVHVASVLAEGRRSYDIVGRWGGEEFMVVLPHEGPDTALAIAEKIRRRLEDSPLPPVGRLTASFGLTVWRDGDSAEGLLARADAALYAAKREGRNRVRLASD